MRGLQGVMVFLVLCANDGQEGLQKRQRDFLEMRHFKRCLGH
ncbi:hypothetical protein HAL07_03690 [Helicobacter ailurogastricus]|uniref:Uncharacterized protein n=1 Tax=Helicobacter ailurogastricus TaxID=1578720 RepID=A0A0K2Y005_9HELI|nr:hypothetical protein HAL013_12820 [Helicobacter ailurogastricus]CRF44287.1 hypothetical protein HAL09_08630 [Helicobacter ailurogastricus]CRF52243.1 hypothetical protein HAL07_03690 [Helicobacter ailurogastricus]